MTRTPQVVTIAVALGSCLLLAAAVAAGWLGPDAGRGATFCEAARPGAVKQPANTFSNLGFVIAGVAIGVAVSHRTPVRGWVLGVGAATSYAVIVTLLGPGSAAMHATQSVAGGHLDLLSMYLIASFAAAWALVRLARRPRLLLPLAAVLVLACELVGAVAGEVPVVRFAGNLAFGVLLVVAIAGEVVLARRDRQGARWAGAAAVTMVVAFGIWLADQHGMCDPDSLLQGHAVWHLLNAVAAYFLYRHYAAQRTSPTTAARQPPT
ncbi:ceramidase domain-containing protein [Nocardioides sambongensis]|uniref:ceramidase domain-containing protein n=1 Tax=Nocardioides sambongensis TaxID=2589074 RepID=UPI0011260E84|nr:ceramidase domain-containing protein [Nocardioides sambongensis]